MERWLMEGAYNKVLTSSQSGMATDLHAQLMSQLATTVRYVCWCASVRIKDVPAHHGCEASVYGK
eukprot:461213-Pelagomonas_calceolata.AAC.4